MSLRNERPNAADEVRDEVLDANACEREAREYIRAGVDSMNQGMKMLGRLHQHLQGAGALSDELSKELDRLIHGAQVPA